MPDDTSPTFAATPWCLLIGFALGIRFGISIQNLAVGIGAGLVAGAASSIARRRGSQSWIRGLGLYAVLVVIVDILTLLIAVH